METVRYLRALVRSWWLVLLTVIAGGAGGYLVYHQATPLYESSVRMIVGLSGRGSDQVSASALTQARASSLSQVATTGPAVQAAYEAAKLGQAVDSVTATSSSSFVTVRVTATSPAAAFTLARAYPSTLPTSLDELSGGPSSGYKLTVVSPAGLPSVPFEPDRDEDVGIGLAAGLILGLAIALLRESLNRSVRDSDALRELTGLTIYGTVPLDLKRKLMPARSDPRSARAESYRQIRTSLLSRTTSRPLVVGVTSATLGEGKTSVTTNVAAIFSRAGHRVAVVDADLRRPRVHSFFDLNPTVGLSDLLAGRATPGEAIIELDEGNLAVLPAGPIPPDPAELIGSEAMVQVLDYLVDRYEFIFIDTPPVLPVTDALVLAPMIDGLLFVTKLGGTTEDRVQKALLAIERVNAEVLGIIPNHAALGGDRAYGYAYAYRPARSERLTASPPSDPATGDDVRGRVGAHAADDDTTDPDHPTTSPSGRARPGPIEHRPHP